MWGSSVNGNNNKALKYCFYAIVGLVAILLSVFCLKKYLKNSNAIYYDLDSIRVGDAFEREIINGELLIYSADNTDGSQSTYIETPNTLLSKGSYTVGITYESDNYNSAYFQAGDEVYDEILLPAGSQTIFKNFELKQPVENARLRINYYGNGYFKINTIMVEGDKPIVSDWLVIFALIWGIGFSIILYAKVYYEGTLTREHIFEISFVIVVACLSIPYLLLQNKGIYWGTDTVVHNMRIEGIKDALVGGQFPVVIAPSMCNGYGSIEPVMYPSLFLYPFSILRILDVSPVMVYKMAHVIINIFMCSTCYVCVKKITRSITASMISLVAFSFSKFHLTMIGACDWTYGMGISMIFMFVIIIGIYEIFFGVKDEWPYLTIGMWGVMNSHILSSVFATVVVGVFSFVFLRKLLNEKRIKSLLYAVGASVPICLYRIYTFLDAMLNNNLNTAALNFHLYPESTHTIKEIITRPMTSIVVFSLVVGIMYLCSTNAKSEQNYKLVCVCVSVSLVCLLCMLKCWNWEHILQYKLCDVLFGYIQFGSRMLQFVLPLCIIIIGIAIAKLRNVNTRITKVALSSVCLIVMCLSIYSYKSEIGAIKELPNSFSDKVTGDVFSFPGAVDYIPEGESEESYDGTLPVYSSDLVAIDAETYEKLGVNISCDVSCTDSGYIDFPLFAYKGYRCTDLAGNEYKVGVGNHHRLRVFFEPTERVQFITIKYDVPKIYFVLQILSYASLFVLVKRNKSFLSRTKKKVAAYAASGLAVLKTYME